jgi:putative ABC transport system permease protein
MTSVELKENLLVAMDTLRAHKARSALTVLGVVIGVTCVISVAAIVTGLNRYIADKVASLGSRTFFVSRIPVGPQNFFQLPAHIRQRKFLQYGDAQYLEEHAPHVEFATLFGTRVAFPGLPGAGQNEMLYEAERVQSFILRGVEPHFTDAFPMFSVAYGRFISRYDDDHARSVVVLGADLADSLFAMSDPLGKVVRLNGKAYEVVGVLQRESGMFGGPGPDQFALIPLSDFHKRYPEAKELILAYSVRPDVSVDAAQDQVIQAMRRLRKVPPDKENDFEVTSPDFVTALWNQLTGALVILTAIISSIGLLVGGVGVMNIMLISVTERTTEIGVRKAIGARRADIRAQFLMEAIAVTLTGGVIGILLGGGISLLIRAVIPSVPATVSYFWVILGVAISVGVGLFFGYYPANRAASLDPIVCLRYE